jgi:cysteine desulfuration protein SufE
MSVLNEYVKDVQILTDRERFVYLIELGEDIGEYPKDKKMSKYEVPGCTSLVYIYLTQEQEKIRIHAYAEAKVVRGYIRILRDALNNNTAQEIIDDTSVPQFIKDAQMNVSTQVSRSNAFGNLYEFIKKQAKQFKS